jgi:hypothetical protein
MFRCIVSADLFRRAYECVSTDQVRYYLNGVCVEPHPDGGAVLAATDGKVLVALRDPDAVVEGGTGIVSASKAILAVCRKDAGMRSDRGKIAKRTPLHVFAEAGRIAVAPRVESELEDDIWSIVRSPGRWVEAYQWHGGLIDGTFPDWRKLIPTAAATTTAPVTIDPALLDRLRSALCAPKAVKTISLTPTGHFAPMVAHGDKTVDGFGVIMPMRGRDSMDLAIPSWGRPAPVMQAAE